MAYKEIDTFDPVVTILNKFKGQIITEFAKVCKTRESYKAEFKTTHLIFDTLYEELNEYIEESYKKRGGN